MYNLQSLLSTKIFDLLDLDISEDNFQEAMAAQACLSNPDEIGIFFLE